MVEAGLVHRQNDNGVKAVAVSALDPDLLNACLRLARLLEMPEQYRVLGPPDLSELGRRATGVTGAPQILSRRSDFRKLI
jgi:hypothetical protein